MPTTKWVKVIGKKEFAALTPDSDDEIFGVYVVFLASSSLDVYYSQQAQIV